MNFGDTILEARKALGLTQKELADLIKKEDGGTITPQYLNDIEHNRRSPSSPEMIEQFAKHTKLPPEVLYYCAGTLPETVKRPDVRREKIVAAYAAFRSALR
jgi:transcriptional regulator with XRE-family HTH domain